MNQTLQELCDLQIKNEAIFSSVLKFGSHAPTSYMPIVDFFSL